MLEEEDTAMSKKTYVIGIAGGSASGKTTFTKKLQEMLEPLKVKVFHMDAYFKDEELRPKSAAFVNGKVYMDDNHPLTMDLPKLANDLEDAVSMAEDEVIIVEGLLTLWDENILKYLDLKLFVDCRADERIVRRIKRNMQWGLTYDQISEVYLDLVRFRHDEYVEPTRWRADFVLNGSAPSDLTLQMIVEWVRKKVE
ncbi:MAG: AAA family ATPase [Lachnospiraceae bacterium]|nr:AAA family ATPase [Lachnospiraceae bacterium]